MKIIYFDCFSGASGDMILGALIDAGLDIKQLNHELSKLKLTGWRLSKKRVKRQDLSGIKVDVVSTTKQKIRFKNLKEIEAIINKSKLRKNIKQDSLKIFKRLTRFEQKAHGVRKEHFHEVGDIDSVIDVVGAVIGLDILGINQIYTSPFILGGGYLKHGKRTLPIPAPATAYSLIGKECVFSNQPYELLTPTGAAILTTLSSKSENIPMLKVLNVGYGAGRRSEGTVPNLLRVVIGERQGYNYNRDQVKIIEASIDDAIPLFYDNLLQRLLNKGALDAYTSVLQMKKGRSGILLTVIALPNLVEELASIIFEETPTLGVRYYDANRLKLPRKICQVKTKYGKIGIKIGKLNNKIVTISPEYEDCRKVAEEKNIPLRKIYEEAKFKGGECK